MAENDTFLGYHQGLKTDSSQYQEISPELHQILNEHQLWLNTGGQKGKRAILPDYSFRGLNLIEQNLQKAILKRADFQGANLTGSDLREAKLTGAKFSSADLTKADFRDADLREAVLADGRNLNACLLARANLAGCRLTEEQKKFSGLGYVKDASGITSNLFTTVLISCVYAGITVFTTSDVSLLTNTSTTSLPLLGVGISVASFYLVAPFLLLAMYIYFHLNLNHLWEALGALPAVFPEGQRLDQRVYPWLFNWLPSSYFIRIKQEPRPIFKLPQRYLSVFFAWYFVPLTLILLWFRYLYVRQWWVTIWHLGLLTVGIWFGFRFYYFAKITLQGQSGENPGGITSNAVMTGSVLLLLACVSDGFINGIPAQLEKKLTPPIAWYQQHRRLVPEALYSLFGLKNVVNFEEQSVSTRTSKEEGQKEFQEGAKEILMARGAILRGSDLRYAMAKGAFLARADMRHAKMVGAYLRGADLREAKLGEHGYPPLLPDFHVDMKNAFLANANLTNACLYRADLFQAILTKANLTNCDLQSAVLAEANLSSAILKNTNLKWTILREANLQDADLTEAKDLTPAQIKQARAWIFAKFDPKSKSYSYKELGLPLDHNDQVKNHNFAKRILDQHDLQRTDLSGFDFTQASFNKANLWKANLDKANLLESNLNAAILKECSLRAANLQGTDLSNAELLDSNLYLAKFQGAKGIKEDQLKRGKNWSLALYDDELIQRLKLDPDHNSHVLEKKWSKFDLRGAYLKDEFLVGVDFQGANLQNADLSGTELSGANLQKANLSNANLTGAFLGWANLQEANLTGANFHETHLDGADLTGVKGFTAKQLQGAIVDSKTKLP